MVMPHFVASDFICSFWVGVTFAPMKTLLVSFEESDVFSISSFIWIVVRDKVAVTVRDKKIEAITKLEEYIYTGTPVINSQGFEIRLNGEDDYNNLINDLNAIETANKPLNDEFFNKWTKFDTYRKIIFKDEVWEYVI